MSETKDICREHARLIAAAPDHTWRLMTLRHEQGGDAKAKPASVKQEVSFVPV